MKCDFDKRGKIFWMLFLRSIFVVPLGVGISLFTIAVGNEECYYDYRCFRNCMLGAYISGVIISVQIFHHFNLFRGIVDVLQGTELCCGGMYLRHVILSSFYMIGMTDVVLLLISADCEVWDTNCADPLLDPDADGAIIRHVTRSLSAACCIMFYVTVLSYWDYFSYLSSKYAFVEALLYASIVGGLCLEAARLIETPKTKEDRKEKNEWSWHTRHDSEKVINYLMKIVCGMFFVFVAPEVIIPLFSSFVRSCKSWEYPIGYIVGTSALFVFAVIIWAVPQAPGFAFDLLVGFVIFQFLMYEDHSVEFPWLGSKFGSALCITIVINTVMRFFGALLRSCVCKRDCVERKVFQVLPVDFLARYNVGPLEEFFYSIPKSWCCASIGAVVCVRFESSLGWADSVLIILFLLVSILTIVGLTAGMYKICNSDHWRRKNEIMLRKRFLDEGFYVVEGLVEFFEDSWVETIEHYHKKLMDQKSAKSWVAALTKYKEIRNHMVEKCFNNVIQEHFEKSDSGTLTVKNGSKNKFLKLKKFRSEKKVATGDRKDRKKKVATGDRKDSKTRKFVPIVEDIEKSNRSHESYHYSSSSSTSYVSDKEEESDGEDKSDEAHTVVQYEKMIKFGVTVIAYFSSLLSYFSIAGEVDMLESVHKGVAALSEVSILAWSALAINMIMLMIFYRKFLIRFILCKHCRGV